MTSQLAVNGGKPVREKPFPKWPMHDEREEEALLSVVRSGEWWYGKKVQEFEQRYAAYQDAKYGITCCNGTIALELGMKALGIQAGDEILVPAYTFIASASSVLQLGAVPVFVDIDPVTANIDLDLAEKMITPRTRALMVVHFGGLPVDLDRAQEIAKRHGIILIEDAAHSWGSKWRGKGTGAHGALGTFSFQVSKNLTCAEGGIIVTDDEEIAKLCRSFTNVGRKEGQPWYFHYVVGGNYRLTEFQAALLLTQMDRLDDQNARRSENAKYLDEEIRKIPGFHPRPADERVTQRAYHLYGFRYIAEEFGGLHRDKMIAALNAEGIPGYSGYPHPVYRNPAFQDVHEPGARYWKPKLPEGVNYTAVNCPEAERHCSDEALWFPHAMLLADRRDMEDIVAAVRKVHDHQHELADSLVQT